MMKFLPAPVKINEYSRASRGLSDEYAGHRGPCPSGLHREAERGHLPSEMFGRKTSGFIRKDDFTLARPSCE